MNISPKAIQIAIGALVVLAGMISVFFSMWAMSHFPDAGFLGTTVWFPVGIFAVMVGTIVVFSGATRTDQKER